MPISPLSPSEPESVAETLKKRWTKLNAFEEEKLANSAKSEKISEPNPHGAIKHRWHEILLLKKHIYLLYHKKEEAMHRQSELEIFLAHFQTAAGYEHQEGQHLMTISIGVIAHFGRQQMLWNPLLQNRQSEIERKPRDISELPLIARDSKLSKATARTELV
jgi:hypothetical protein